MAESSSTQSTNVAKLAVPILFGPLINWALYGALCVQTYVYSYNFPDDRRVIKCLVCFVFLLETAQTALTGADVHYWFISGFGDVERLKSSHFAPIDIPIVDSIISFIVQEYFCYRIWTLNRRSSWFCLVIAVVAVIQSIGAMWGGIRSLMLGKYAVSRSALYLWSLPSGLADILIAVAMTLLLRRTRGNEGPFSNHVLPRIVRLTIETNTVTAAVAIVSFVLYVAFPNEIYYTCTAGIIGKLYSNTLLVSLNNRIYFRDHPTPKHSRNNAQTVDCSGRTEQSIIRSALRFAQVEPTSSHVTTSSDTIKLGDYPHSVDIEKGKGIDAISTNSVSSNA